MATTKEYKKRIIKHLVCEVLDSSEMWNAIMDDQDIGNEKQKHRIRQAIWQAQFHMENFQ